MTGLDRAVDWLLGTRLWTRKWWLLRRYPVLRGPSAATLLAEYAEDAIADGDDPDIYLLHLALVRRAAETGPLAATREVRTYVRMVPSLARAGATAYESYRSGSDPPMLDIAIAAFERAAALTGAGLPERSSVLSNLGLSLTERHDATGNDNDLRRAVNVLEEAMRSAPDPERRLVAAVNFASAVASTGDPDSLAAAASLLDGADTPAALACLGRCQLELFRITGDPVELDRAVQALDRITGSGEPRQLTNLGVALSERHLLAGLSDDLERAVELLRGAVGATAPGSPGLPARLAALGSVLAERFTRRGEPADLDEAVTIMESALRGTPPGSPDRPDWQQNLALVLRDRYLRDGDLPDLERARTLLEPYAEDAGDQLAVTLRMRWQHRGDRADLDRAVELHRAAVAGLGPHAAVVQNNAGGTYRALWAATGDPAALDPAVHAYRAALAAMPTTSPERAPILANLAMGLLNRHATAADPADLDEAVATAREAAGAPGQSLTLANALRARYDHGGDPRDAEQAEAAYRASVAHGEPVAAETWLRSGQAYGDWAAARRHRRDAASAYGTAVTAADRLLRRQLAPADVEAWLLTVGKLPAGAAYAHLRLDDMPAAVGRLEWGRARLLTDALERNRADLRSLAETAPGLAARLRTLEVRT